MDPWIGQSAVKLYLITPFYAFGRRRALFFFIRAKRFTRYFNPSYLKNRETLVISRALIKYGYFNFSLEILEYCDINLTEREQYYLDKLNPKYNTLKIAGSSRGHKLTEETKTKISQSLKGIYVQEKSALYGRNHSE